RHRYPAAAPVSCTRPGGTPLRSPSRHGRRFPSPSRPPCSIARARISPCTGSAIRTPRAAPHHGADQADVEIAFLIHFFLARIARFQLLLAVTLQARRNRAHRDQRVEA